MTEQEPPVDQRDGSTQGKRPVWPLVFLIIGGLLTISWIVFLGWLPLRWFDLL